MKILIIDAFKQKKASSSFNRLANSVLRSVFGPIPYSVLRLGISDFESFSVDVSASHGGETTQMREFDKISLVIADGSASILPWSDTGLLLTRIATMILVTEKPAVCFGCVANCISFALATGGGEPPSRKSQIDRESGDYYEFLPSQQQKDDLGMPSGNVGLTSLSSRAFSSNKRSQSSFMSRKPKLVSSLSQSNQVILDRPGRVDKIASIRPEENSHFSVSGLPSMKVVIQHPSDWQIQSNAITCGMYAGRIIAQLSPGFPVLFHVRNTIGCAFHLCHPASETILFNSLSWLIDAITCEKVLHVKLWDALCGLLPVRYKGSARISTEEMRKKQQQVDDDDEHGSNLPSSSLLPLDIMSRSRPPTAPWSREASMMNDSSQIFGHSETKKRFTTDKLFPKLNTMNKSRTIDLNLI